MYLQNGSLDIPESHLRLLRRSDLFDVVIVIIMNIMRTSTSYITRIIILVRLIKKHAQLLYNTLV